MTGANVYSGDYARSRGAYISDAKVTPTLTSGGTYASGDYVGTSGTAMVFSVIEAGGGGYIIGGGVIDGAGASGVACEIWVFDEIITPPADNAAWSISDAHAKNKVAIIPISTFYASALNNTGDGEPISPKHFISASGNLYACVITRGAPVFANGDITVRLDGVSD